MTDHIMTIKITSDFFNYFIVPLVFTVFGIAIGIGYKYDYESGHIDRTSKEDSRGTNDE